MDDITLKNKLSAISNTLLDIVDFNNGGCGKFAVSMMNILDSLNKDYTVVLYIPIIAIPTNNNKEGFYEYVAGFNDLEDINRMNINEYIVFNHIDIMFDGQHINDKVRLRNGSIAKYSQTYVGIDRVEVKNTDYEFNLFKNILIKSIKFESLWNQTFINMIGQSCIDRIINENFNELKIA